MGRGRYSGPDTYALDEALGAVPFMTIGNAMSDADLSAFIDNRCTAMTNYNSPQLGRASNENWNNGAGHISYRSQ